MPERSESWVCKYGNKLRQLEARNPKGSIDRHLAAQLKLAATVADAYINTLLRWLHEPHSLGDTELNTCLRYAIRKRPIGGPTPVDKSCCHESTKSLGDFANIGWD